MQNTESAGQQRQITDIKKVFGDTFSLLDPLLQMQKRIDVLEVQRMQPPRG